jgi:hypothetical protein
MATLTVTAKGQITLRRDLLRHLGVQPGQQIEVRPLPRGARRQAAGPHRWFLRTSGRSDFQGGEPA